MTNIDNLIDALNWIRCGKEVQYRTRGTTLECCWSRFTMETHSTILYLAETFEFRIKPAQKLRCWRENEVPIGALIRTKHRPETVRVILSICCGKVILNQSLPSHSRFISDLFTYHGGHNGDANEHSIDGGKTWLPCGTLTSD